MEAELKPNNHRVEAFSDGVFAIVVTIMVIDIHVPGVLASRDDPAALAQLATLLTAYALSFLVIANLWTSHHYLTFTLSTPSTATLWFNNLLLFCVSLTPVTTRFLGLHPLMPRAAAAYGLVAFACTAAFMLLRRHAARITRNALHREIHHRILRRTWIILAIYLASILLAFINPWLAWACFVIVPPMLFLPIIRAPVPGASHGPERGLVHRCP